MQPNNTNPAGFMAGLPDNSFGGGQPPAPTAAPPQPQYPPFNPAQYASMPPTGTPGYGDFSQPPAVDPLGIPGGQPPMVLQPQGGQYPPVQQSQNQGQPAPYQQPYTPPMAPPPVASDQPPAWAQELAQMIQQNQGGAADPNAAVPPAAPGWKPNSWDDVLGKVTEITKNTLTEKERTEQMAKSAEDAKVDSILKDIDNQLQTMRYYGQMPLVQNPYDPNDPGKTYQRELIGLADVLNTTSLNAVNQQLQIAHRGGFRFDPTTKNFVSTNGQGYTPAGMNSPISGGAAAGGTAPAGGQLPPIGQLRRASLGELMGGLTNEVSGNFGY